MEEDIIRAKQFVIGSISGATLAGNAEVGTLIISGAKLWVKTAPSGTEGWETITSA